jgi:hypothetical protein
MALRPIPILRTIPTLHPLRQMPQRLRYLQTTLPLPEGLYLRKEVHLPTTL